MLKILMSQNQNVNLYHSSFQFLVLLMLHRQIIVFIIYVLRSVVFFLFVHALGTKPWQVQQSFQQVLHGRVPRCVVAVNSKPEVKKLVK